MLTTLLLPVLLAPSSAAMVEPSPPALLVRATADVDALTTEYDAAVQEWRAAIENAEDKTVRNELRRNHPAKRFFPRFEALAEKGEGRALLWLASHLKEKGLRASQRGPVATEYFQKLFADHAGAEWFGDAVAALMNEAKVEAATKRDLLRHAIEKSDKAGTKAPAMFGLGVLLMEGSDDEKAEGERLLKAVASTFPKTSWGTMAQAMFITEADLEVGKSAPDFYGETIDGFGFNLSDYRGKVVLLDFYGFW